MNSGEILEQFAAMPQVFDEDDGVESLAAHKVDITDIFLNTTEATTRLTCAGALARIDPASSDAILPVLMQALSEDRMEAGFAAYCLGLLGHVGRPAVPTLIGLLKHDNVVVVCNAAGALGRIGASESVPALIDVLSGGDVACATEAAIALGEIGSNDAMPSLRVCLNRRGDHFVQSLRLAAAEAIWQISGDPTDAVAVAAEMLESEKEWLVANACQLIADVGVAAGLVADKLRGLLVHHDACVRQEAANAMLRCSLG